MNKILITFAAIVSLSSCGPTTTKDPAELSVGGCGSYERGRLAGLRAGANMRRPDPSTEHGRSVIEEMEYLTIICEGEISAVSSQPE